jgi:antibiotic biosynthesis monooxygenase (ABM) superfamily enzyme
LGFLFVFLTILGATAIGRLDLPFFVHWALIATVIAVSIILKYFVMLRRGRMVLIPNKPVN